MSDDKVKDALNMIPYGFYCIGTRNGDDVNLMVANWFSQVSFTPRRVALALQKTAYSHGLLEAGKVFSVNIFSKEDDAAIRPYTKGRGNNPDKMAQAQYTEGAETGCPIIDGAAAYIECKVVEVVDFGGDHDVVIGEPVGADVRKEGKAADTLTLIDIGWSYAG